MFTCPISHEEVSRVCGITVNGSAYKYEAIKDWFKHSDRDPLTNLSLPSTFVVRYRFFTNEGLEAKCKSMRDSLAGWCPNFKLMDPAALDPILEKVKHCWTVMGPHMDSPLWRTYVEFIYDLLKKDDNNPIYLGWKKEEIMGPLRGKRTEVLTALGVDPSIFPPNDFFVCVPLNASLIEDIPCFKGVSFNGADVSGVIPEKVQFQRTKWIGARFRGAIFVKSSFIGEGVTFYGCAKSGDSEMIDCIVEKGFTWKTLRGEAAREEFIKRGFN